MAPTEIEGSVRYIIHASRDNKMALWYIKWDLHYKSLNITRVRCVYYCWSSYNRLEVWPVSPRRAAVGDILRNHSECPKRVNWITGRVTSQVMIIAGLTYIRFVE